MFDDLAYVVTAEDDFSSLSWCCSFKKSCDLLSTPLSSLKKVIFRNSMLLNLHFMLIVSVTRLPEKRELSNTNAGLQTVSPSTFFRY